MNKNAVGSVHRATGHLCTELPDVCPIQARVWEGDLGFLDALSRPIDCGAFGSNSPFDHMNRTRQDVVAASAPPPTPV